MLAVIVAAAVASLLLVGQTFVLLGGGLSTETMDLTVMANAQRQALQLQVAVVNLDGRDDLDEARTKLGLLQMQTSVIAANPDPRDGAKATITRVQETAGEIGAVLDELDGLPVSQWPAIVDATLQSVATLEVDVKRSYDIVEKRTQLSVRADAAAKQRSQRFLLVLSGLTLTVAAGMGTMQWRRARSSLLRAQDALLLSAHRFRSLVQQSSDLVLVVERDGRIEYCSPAGEVILGPDAILPGTKLADAVHADDLTRLQVALARATKDDGSTEVIEFRLRRNDGSWVQMESTVRDLVDVPSVHGLVLNARDITEQKRLETELRHRAFHDDLTGLANRTLFADRLAHAAARGNRRPVAHAVMLIDLDGFKEINDSLGHETGDVLLVDVAHRLEANLRQEHTLARLGGDEFAVLVEDVQSEREAVDVATRLVDCLVAPFAVGGRSVVITASVGVAMTSPTEPDEDVLLRNADLAMYVAKRLGKSRVEAYEPWMLDDVVERLDLESELNGGFDDDQFVLHYQPLVRLDSGEIYGYEALVRWMHPSRGLLHPSEFITVVEEAPLIFRLGARILEMALVQAGAWQRETSLPLVISVNVSTRQLEDPTFPAIVANLLDCVDLVPGTLMLEVTESGLVGGVPAVLDVLQQLRSLGVRVAIDDFGTGYSSLAYLKDLPVDTLKLDKSFVDDLRYGERSVVGEAIVTLCTTLGLDVVAEGIEHPDQLEALQRLGCPNGQGFLFARPLAADEIRSIAGLTELLPSLHR